MLAEHVGGKQHHFLFYFIYDTIKYGNKKRGRMCLPLPAQKNFRLSPASLSVCVVFNRLARRRELTGERKASRTFLISAVFLTRKKGTKNRNEKAEAERKVLQCGLSYDGAFSFAKKVLWRYHSMVMVYKSNSIVIHTIVPNDY